MKTIQYWVYILECENGNYYTGYTNDLARRYQEHLNGSDKCKYTRSFKPLRLASSWLIHGDKSLALKIEKYIKKLSKKEKKFLISNPKKLTDLFECLVET